MPFPIRARYAYRIEDFEDIAMSSDRLTPRGRRIRAALTFTGVLLLVSPFLAGSGFTHPDEFLLGMVPMAFCLIAWGQRSVRRAARKQYAACVTGREDDVILADDGITVLSSIGRTELKWAAFSSVIEGKTAIALVFNGLMFLLPRRAFGDEQWAEIVSQLQARVPVWDGKTRTVRLLS